MQQIIDFVHYCLEDRKMTAEEILQLNKICELEEKFLEYVPQDKWQECFDLEKQKSQLHSIETDLIINLAYKLCKKRYFTKLFFIFIESSTYFG